jgi:hypothetical protein
MCTMSRRPKLIWEGSVWCRGWRALMSAQLERVIATGVAIPTSKDGDAAELLCGWRCRGVLQCVRQVSGAPTACCSCKPVGATMTQEQLLEWFSRRDGLP